jgi:ribonuclease P protein component
VVHALRDENLDDGPKVGLVVSKSVGSAVQRHRVARRLRHVAYQVIAECRSDLEPSDLVVIRALPGSSAAQSSRLDSQLRAALKRMRIQRQARS